MEITISIKEGELLGYLKDMSETGKDTASRHFSNGPDSLVVQLCEATVDGMLEQLRKVKKAEERSILLDEVIIPNGENEISFLVVPEYKSDIFKDTILREA